MLHVFRLVVGKQCERLDCAGYHQRVGIHEVFCHHCDQALAPVAEADRRRIALVTLVGLVILIGATSLVYTVLSRRAALKEAEILARADDLFRRSLAWATTADVEERADAIQRELGLTLEQRRKMLESASGATARLMQPVSKDLERRLENLLRTAYRDGRMSYEERQRLDAFVSEQRIVPAEALAFERKVTARIETAQRSNSRGSSLVRQRQYEEARSEFQNATEADPGDPIAWANLGAAYMLLGNENDAASCYERALAIDESHWLVRYNLGVLAARKGDSENAFRHFEKALTSIPKTADRERRAIVQELLDDPSLNDLRSHPRFVEIMSGIGAS